MGAVIAGALLLSVPTAAARPGAFELPYRFPRPPSEQACLRAFRYPCYRPAQIQRAYDLPALYRRGLTGRGRTIVIVDSFGSPTIRHDVGVFDRAFGLPAVHLSIIKPAGPIPRYDGHDADMVGWAVETTLDVEWAHTIAPGAHLLLVETPVDETEGVQGFPEIVASENYVIDHGLGDVISQSFGATEETFTPMSAILGLRSAFVNAAAHDVSVLAGSGDADATNFELNGLDLYPVRVNSWPSSDPLVTSVGGTRLFLDASGRRTAPDRVWNSGSGGSGGGVSAVFARPAYQNPVAPLVGPWRGTPDVSMNAADTATVLIYASFPEPALGPGWYPAGGTSEAVQLFGGVVAIADQAAGRRLGELNAALYGLGARHAPGLVDVTRGDNTTSFTNSAGQHITVPGYRARRGYDLASGLGTIDAARLVAELAR
ncbi:MAG TPA: S53 family peptidase [Solirubrobacteraceae bacterium]|nr:S53 family peptidase [Solirubrobacteraceae bacterium]